ncbi:cysteine desulfurase [Methanobacterium formicicum DSM 3637]|uniref:Multifunctional fusion protein n=2 Tax=Methanobacterium formicicum TaxID=2162 RepID=K2QAT3_METFP|nr:formate dehydrogenase accessory sulfurtransferase FdhD [Methanobacterium formicicum]EKF85071.1 cysteine desulfurase [Methanobacterium formicicum DSM 3637]
MTKYSPNQNRHRVYLDHSATSSLDPEVWEAMEPYFKDNFGNPSTLYLLGRQAKKATEKARKQVASLIGASPDEVYFTSGGTESDNMAILGTVNRFKIANRLKNNGNHIITSSIEHPAVLETCKHLEQEGFRVTFLPVDGDGIVDVADVEESITDKTILITIMHANNEIGTIQPIKRIGKIAREKGIVFHTDAVQSVGKIPVNVEDMNVDLLSISAHKLYGPKGAGVLYIRKGVKLEPLFHGGGHERGMRPGTENVPGIVGLGKACQIADENLEHNRDYITQLRDRLIREVLERIDEVQLNGHLSKRLPGNAHFSFKGVRGEPLTFLLDSKRVDASTGSACSTKKVEPSHVLLAIGLDEEDANGSLRVTLGKDNTSRDVDLAVKAIKEAVETLRAPASVKGMTEIVPIKRYTAVSKESFHGKNSYNNKKSGLITGDDEIVIDEQVNLIINEKFSRSFSISPEALEEFATGYLLGEGLVASVDGIKKIEIDGLNINVEIDLADFDIKDLVVGSDCFGGWRRKIETINRVESEFTVTKDDIFWAIEKLRDEAKVWQNTGGAHVAGMVYQDKFISREDVSRHVAADKVIGASAMENVDFSQTFMVYSGRMPADMMIKLARVGVPIIASNAAPTSSGYSVAFKAGITMIGFLRGNRFNIYTNPQRILME